MSLGIAFKGPEGIVLAADSRVTLTAVIPEESARISATFDNATKLLRIAGQDYVGVVTYGLGALGEKEPRTAHSYVPELERGLRNERRMPVDQFAKHLSNFFMERWKETMSEDVPADNTMHFLIGGYDKDAAYGRVFEVVVPDRPEPLEQNAGGFGMTWGGQRELVDRLIQGFDDRVPPIVQEAGGLSDEDRDKLRRGLRGRLQLSIPYAFLPLQDCVDLATFLIQATAKLQTWMVGVRGVGGAVDVATITRTEGFAPVQVKTIMGERTREGRWSGHGAGLEQR